MSNAYQHHQSPSITQCNVGITSSTPLTPSEDGHVPNRYRRKSPASTTELRSRPRARCTVVQVHSIGIYASCSDSHETVTCCSANTNNSKQHASCKHVERISTPTTALLATTQHGTYLYYPPRKWPRSQQMLLQDYRAPH